MSDLIEIGEQKITAAQVEQDCPTELAQLGKQIAAHLKTARKYEGKAEDQYTAIGQYLVRAKELCDPGGLRALREKFFPDLGKSRASELLQIASGKKSIEDVRASTRERVAKSRANKAASDTVTDNSHPAPAPQGAASSVDQGEAESTQAEATSQASKPRRGVSSGNEGVSNFTVVVTQLVQLTKKRKPSHFTETAVSADDLARLGKLLTQIAKLKQSNAPPPLATAGNDTLSPEQSGEEMKRKHAAAEAADDLAAA